MKIYRKPYERYQAKVQAKDGSQYYEDHRDDWYCKQHTAEGMLKEIDFKMAENFRLALISIAPELNDEDEDEWWYSYRELDKLSGLPYKMQYWGLWGKDLDYSTGVEIQELIVLLAEQLEKLGEHICYEL
jgi:hypothetical protein